MTTTDQGPEFPTPAQGSEPVQIHAEEQAGGGGGQPIDGGQTGISIQPYAIFDQGPFTEPAIASEWGIARDDLRAWRIAHLEDGPDWSLISRTVTYTPLGKKKAAAALAVAVVAPSPPPPASDAPQATLEPPAADVITYAVWRLVPNTRLVMFGEKTAGGEKKGPELRLKVREAGKFSVGMDLTGRIRLLDGHTDYYELACPQPRHRGRW